MFKLSTIAALILLGLGGLGCSGDPVVGSWIGSKGNLAFSEDGTLRSLEAAAHSQASAVECEDAGYLEEVEKCSAGGWSNSGDGYEIQTVDLIVLDGGSRVNCTCSHSVLYAQLADANLVIYDKKGGVTLDTLHR
jgi:hypothetical protein